MMPDVLACLKDLSATNRRILNIKNELSEAEREFSADLLLLYTLLETEKW